VLLLWPRSPRLLACLCPEMLFQYSRLCFLTFSLRRPDNISIRIFQKCLKYLKIPDFQHSHIVTLKYSDRGTSLLFQRSSLLAPGRFSRRHFRRHRTQQGESQQHIENFSKHVCHHRFDSSKDSWFVSIYFIH
jgi:hypothetical protein